MTTVIDTPDGIAFAQMAALKGALKLEVLGLKRHGRTAYSIAKERYGLKGSRESVLEQLTKMVEDALSHKPA